MCFENIISIILSAFSCMGSDFFKKTTMHSISDPRWVLERDVDYNGMPRWKFKWRIVPALLSSLNSLKLLHLRHNSVLWCMMLRDWNSLHFLVLVECLHYPKKTSREICRKPKSPVNLSLAISCDNIIRKLLRKVSA